MLRKLGTDESMDRMLQLIQLDDNIISEEAGYLLSLMMKTHLEEFKVRTNAVLAHPFGYLWPYRRFFPANIAAKIAEALTRRDGAIENSVIAKLINNIQFFQQHRKYTSAIRLNQLMIRCRLCINRIITCANNKIEFFCVISSLFSCVAAVVAVLLIFSLGTINQLSSILISFIAACNGFSLSQVWMWYWRWKYVWYRDDHRLGSSRFILKGFEVDVTTSEKNLINILTDEKRLKEMAYRCTALALGMAGLIILMNHMSAILSQELQVFTVIFGAILMMYFTFLLSRFMVGILRSFVARATAMLTPDEIRWLGYGSEKD